jgi:hypothetical protein
MTIPATSTEHHEGANGGKRLSERPALVFLLSAVVCFVFGAIFTLLGSVDAFGFLDTALVIAIVLVVLGAASVSVVAAVGSIERDEVEIEFWLFVASAVYGVLIFIPLLSAFVAGVAMPYIIGLEDWDVDAAEMYLGGFILILLGGAAMVSVITGAPVGVIAWASRFARSDLDALLRRIPDLPWPWRVGLGVPLVLGLTLALGALISWLAEGYHRPDTLQAGRVEDFRVGEPRLYEEEDVWLVRVSEGPALSGSEFEALYDRGLVTGCPLQWRSEYEFAGRRGWFVDACNGAAYDFTGRCASDPCSGIHLDRFFVSVYGDQVVVNLDEVIRDPAAGETLGPTIPAVTPNFPTPSP